MSISDRLFTARTAAKLTQKKVADLLGVKPQTVSQWETGKINIGVEHIAQLSDLYGVSCDWLIKGKLKPATNLLVKNKLIEMLEALGKDDDHHL